MILWLEKPTIPLRHFLTLKFPLYKRNIEMRSLSVGVVHMSIKNFLHYFQPRPKKKGTKNGTIF